MTIPYFLERFKDIYEGNPWFGESIEAKLQGVTNKNAFIQPHEGVHSIGELVAHMTYWRLPLVKYLSGDTAYKGSMESEDNWPSLDRLSKKGWSKVYKEFVDTQEKIMSLLAEQDNKLLKKKYSDKYTFGQLIQGIVEHDIYHLGQIAITKKLIL